MNQHVHIVFGESAYGSLKAALKSSTEHQHMKVFCISEDYSYGPVYKLETDEGIQQRKEWIHALLTQTGPESDSDYKKWIESIFDRNMSIADEVSNNSTVILWHGSNASDQLGIRWVIFLLQNKNLLFEEIDVTAYSRNIQYTVRDLDGMEIPYELKSTGALPPELIPGAFQLKKPISEGRLKGLIQDWARWSQSDSLLRILVNDKLTAVPVDYYDVFLLEHVADDYQLAARVVGAVIGDSNHVVGDTYLAFRVRQLIDQGKLSYRGELGSLRDYEIRLK